MADAKEPEKDLKKLEEEQAKEDAALLANLEKESKEFDKVSSRKLRLTSPLFQFLIPRSTGQ